MNLNKRKNIKKLAARLSVMAAIIAAGLIAVFSAPEAVESFLPKVDTSALIAADYCETVSGSGNVALTEDGWFLNVFVGESDIRRVRKGQLAAITGAAFDDDVYSATVTNISPVAVRKASDFAYETAVEVELKINDYNEEDIDESNILRSGYSARAEIKTGGEREIYIVPYSVIRQDDLGEYVYILSGNSVIRRYILTGAELAQGAEILKGLTPDDEIISNPESAENKTLVRRNSQDVQ